MTMTQDELRELARNAAIDKPDTGIPPQAWLVAVSLGAGDEILDITTLAGAYTDMLDHVPAVTRTRDDRTREIYYAIFANGPRAANPPRLVHDELLPIQGGHPVVAVSGEANLAADEDALALWDARMGADGQGHPGESMWLYTAFAHTSALEPIGSVDEGKRLASGSAYWIILAETPAGTLYTAVRGHGSLEAASREGPLARPVAAPSAPAHHVGMHWDHDYVSEDVEDRRGDPVDPSLAHEPRAHGSVATVDPWASTDPDPWAGGGDGGGSFDLINTMTDELFYESHPELNRRRLDPQHVPGDAELAHEWVVMRDFVVTQGQTKPGAAGARAAARRNASNSSIASETTNKTHSSGDHMNSLDPWTAMRSRPPSTSMYVPHAAGPAVLGLRSGLSNLGHRLFGHGHGPPQGWGKYRRQPGLVLDVAPAFHPVQEVQVTLADLDPNQVLNVTVKIDGRTYHAAVDLTRAIGLVMKRLAKWRATEVARGRRHALVGADPAGAVDAAVGAAASALVGKMIDDHASAVCGGWLSDIEHAASGAVSALKGPITAAATAAVSSIPGIGPMAANMVPTLINAATGSGSAKGAVAALKAQAAQNPQVQAALNAAQQVAAKAAAAAHVAQNAAAAAAGNPAAQAQIAQVNAAAAQGDPAAQQAAQVASMAQGGANPQQLLQQLLGALGVAPGGGASAPAPGCMPAPACPAPAPTPPTGGRHGRGGQPAPSGPAPAPAPCPAPACCAPACAPACATPAVSGALVGAAIDEMRHEAIERAQQEVHVFHGRGAGKSVIAYVKAASGDGARAFPTLDDADDWLGGLDGGSFIYAAYFDAEDPTWPEPINERLGEVVRATPGAQHVVHGPYQGHPHVSGGPIAIMAALAAGAGGMAAFDRRAAIKSWLTGKAA